MNPLVKLQKIMLPGNLQNFSEQVLLIYEQAINDYHLHDSINQQVNNPWPAEQLEHLLYTKCWIDTVQWHVEDEIRKTDINPGTALKMKRKIDALNQQRTNQVEMIDHYFLLRYAAVTVLPAARVNSESPAWALDRLSILALKIFHMQAEVVREDATPDHIRRCRDKLAILREQCKDLSLSINELLQDIAVGAKYMKVYKQMKMYNDPTLNPVLYQALKTEKLPGR